MISLRLPGFGGKPKMPEPPPPPEPEPLPPVTEMPDTGNVLAAQQKKRKRAAASVSGRQSTILSDALGGDTLG